jgi:hypothetical protein
MYFIFDRVLHSLDWVEVQLRKLRCAGRTRIRRAVRDEFVRVTIRVVSRIA